YWLVIFIVISSSGCCFCWCWGVWLWFVGGCFCGWVFVGGWGVLVVFCVGGVVFALVVGFGFGGCLRCCWLWAVGCGCFGFVVFVCVFGLGLFLVLGVVGFAVVCVAVGWRVWLLDMG
ncbi:hypothetical protein RA274_27695, partial [Pseudomonas syringae pv. tagetis]|uniref:hypothetical protein n=1 Tax=Pseudomonas syringae group genomosp. 7 TaxID=251699 RepID=UPI0037707507